MTESAHAPLPAFKSDEGRARYLAAYDAVLREWPVPWEGIDVPTPLGTTHVIASGPRDAPPLLLLPSFAATATVWRLNVAGLGRAFRTYSVDVIGQPGKSVANRRMHDRRDYADWIVDLLDGLGVQRASLVGCSFGGFLALNQAVMSPDRVERVVAISPVGVFASQAWKLFYLMRIRSPVLRLARRVLGRPAAVPGVRRTPRDTAWAALMGVTMAEAPEVSVINAGAFAPAELRAIRAPVLLLIGKQETLYEPHATLALARARTPALTGAIVADADHLAAMAQPDVVNQRIIQFLGA